jgi:CelD/BcsL family acetyltransferase involved in cellulose biosynthesis
MPETTYQDRTRATDPTALIKVRLIDDLASWSRLESEWDDLLLNSSCPSIFLSYDYLSRAWKYFHKQNSQPFLLTLHDANDRLVGIAPFRRGAQTIRGRSFQVVRHALSWEVDKPYVIALADMEAEVWRGVAEFFHSHPDQWDILSLEEMPADLMGVNRLQQLFNGSRYSVEVVEGASGAYIDLTGQPGEFTRKHKKFKEKLRRVEKLPQGYHLEIHDTPDTIAGGFEKFVAIEEKSWKKGKIGVTKDDTHLAFYQEMVPALAAKGRSTIRIMSTGDTLLAGTLTYAFGDTVFFHQTAYNPEFRKHSPGAVLIGLLIEGLLGQGYRRADCLCGYADYLQRWTSAEVHTSNVVVYRKSVPMSLLLGGRKIKQMLTRRSTPAARDWGLLITR